MAAKIATGAKPCPFCKNTKIHYSTTCVNSCGDTYYNAVCYCKDCKATGPVIKSETCKTTMYKQRDQIMNSSELKQQAINTWNNRSS